MAAGLGTRLRPLTYEVPKPMVPVANRPIMEHVLRLAARHGFREIIANLHWFADTISDRFGDGSELGVELAYRHEEELLGTAGGVRNVRDFFGGESFLVLAADPLTDVDLSQLAAAHRDKGGIATLAVKRVENVSEFGVVVTDEEGRVQGFQEKPDPAEALSELASCMIYVLEPEVFDYFPDKQAVDFALDVFPALLEHDVPFHVHEVDAYWNDVGSIPEFLQGNLDALEGAVEVEPAGELVEGAEADDEPSPGRYGRILLGEDCEIAESARLEGPLIVGSGARIGESAIVRQSVLLPDAEVPSETLVVGSICGRRGALARKP
jgi:mannose-1-phosphate guanylyltransferase/mannose-1-phosphate guanylyltransferase/phosphomannomutase